MMMRLFTILVSLCLSYAVKAQQVVRYQSADKKLYTPAEVDSVLASRNRKMAAQAVDLRFTKEVTGTRIQGDTLLYTFILRGANQRVLDNEARYTAFVGKPLPEFALRDLNGRVVKSASLRGRPLVINMWFTSCGPCIVEMPALNQFKAKNPDVQFVAMTYEPREKVQQFLRKRPFNFTHIPGAQAYCDQFTHNYPISIFVDKAGIVQKIMNGMPTRYDSVAKKTTDEVNTTEFQDALRAVQ